MNIHRIDYNSSQYGYPKVNCVISDKTPTEKNIKDILDNQINILKPLISVIPNDGVYSQYNLHR